MSRWVRSALSRPTATGWFLVLIGVVDWLSRLDFLRSLWERLGLNVTAAAVRELLPIALVLIGLAWVGYRSRPQEIYANAPFLAWLYPAAALLPDGRLALDVYCENAGPRDSEAVIFAGYYKPAGDGEQYEVPIAQWSRILSRKLGDQHRFKVEIRSDPHNPPRFGEREISWGAVYIDGANPDRVYVTEASVKADFQAIGPAEVTQQWMDATSTAQERRRRWDDRAKRKKK